MMPKRFLIHKTRDFETGEPYKEFYTQNPIPEGTEFEVQYEGQTLRFRMDLHWIIIETRSSIELISVDGGVKRPRLPK